MIVGDKDGTKLFSFLSFLKERRGGYGIICKTEEAAQSLMKYLGDRGYTWMSGEPYSETDTKWRDMGENTVYLSNTLRTNTNMVSLDVVIYEWSPSEVFDWSSDSEYDCEAWDSAVIDDYLGGYQIV